jgi:hypothetical protein
MPRRGHEARHGQRVHGNHHCDDRYDSGNHHNRAWNGDHQMTDAVQVELIRVVPSITALAIAIMAFVRSRDNSEKIKEVKASADGLQTTLLELQGSASYGKGQMDERNNQRDFAQKEKENLNDSTKT